MNLPTRALALCLLLPLLRCTALADDSPQQPHGSEKGHVHPHPEIDIAHAIITESAVPETEIMLRYAFVAPGDGIEHAMSASLEYAFLPTFSVEVEAPYVIVDPSGGGPAGRFGDVEIAAKFATYAFADKGFIPAFGLAVGLPTGDDASGVGSDHVVELAPFVRAGYVSGPFHFAASAEIGIPFNQTSTERDEEDFTFGYNLAIIYHAAPNVQAMVELHGESVFGGDDSHAFYVSPGVTFQPFQDESINLGISVSLPLTDDREFDYAINLLAIIHL